MPCRSPGGAGNESNSRGSHEVAPIHGPDRSAFSEIDAREVAGVQIASGRTALDQHCLYFRENARTSERRDADGNGCSMRMVLVESGYSRTTRAA